MKALLIVSLVIIGNGNACADFSLEAKCLKDERTGIIITYNESGKPIVVKDCKNPESTKLFYWRTRYILAVSKGEKKYITQYFASVESLTKSIDMARINEDSKVKGYATDIYNLD